MDADVKKKTGEKVSLSYAWYALFVMFMINLFNYIDRLSIGPAMEVIKRHYNVTDTDMGLIMSAFMAVYSIISVPAGLMSDKGRRTRFVAVGALVWSVFATLSGFAKTFTSFFVARAFVGSGEGIYAPSGGPLVADYFPKKLRNTAISIFMAAMIVGGAMAYIVAGVILKKTERFDMPKITSVVVDKEEKEIDGWAYKGVSETKDRLAKFEFVSPQKENLALIVSRYDKKKEADYKSKIFDLNYQLNGKEISTEQAPASVQAFIGTINDRVTAREGRGIERVSATLNALPRHFKVPEKYADALVYDKKEKKLTYVGVMTEADRKVVERISDKEEYIKAISSIYSDTSYHYMRSDNFKWIFIILGPPGLLFAFLAFMLKEPIKGGSEDFLTEEEARTVDAKGKVNFWVVFTIPSVFLLIVANILTSYCVGALNTWLFPFVERYKGIPSADAAIQFGPYVVLCAAAGVVLSGIIADKFSKKTVIANNIIICAGLIASIPCLYGFFSTDNVTFMVMYLCAGIFFLSWINGPFNALLISLVEPRLRAVVIGVEILLIHCLGDAISPLVVGYLSDTHSLRYALNTLPAFLIAGIVVFIISAFFVPRDLKAMEKRMKDMAGTAA